MAPSGYINGLIIPWKTIRSKPLVTPIIESPKDLISCFTAVTSHAWIHTPTAYPESHRHSLVPASLQLTKDINKETMNPGIKEETMVLEHEELTGLIIGAAIKVHRTLGPGFLESIYENALAIELRQQDIPFSRQLSVPVLYRGAEVGLHRLDMFVDNLIVVELKTSKRLADIDFIVVRSYLRAVNREHGLLLNFATPTLEAKRVLAGS